MLNLNLTEVHNIISPKTTSTPQEHMKDANISPTSDQTLPTTPLLMLADSWSWLENVSAAPAGIIIILFLLLSVSLGTLFNFLMARTAFL